VFRPGRLQIINLSIQDLVAFGYGIIGSPYFRDALIVGWPNNGIQRKRFDIQATITADGTLSVEDQRRVVLDVLESRFGFQAHREQRLFNGWVMTLVRPEVLGPGLKRVDFNCAEINPEDAPRDQSGRSSCRRGVESLPGQPTLTYHGSGSMDTLAVDLERQSRHLVVNETRLQGFFVWDFAYRIGLRGTNQLETAFHEDLGIKLESKRLPASVVVIDDVRMPTPN
jgi:uncharacterized protein (TIGR03435 family)